MGRSHIKKGMKREDKGCYFKWGGVTECFTEKAPVEGTTGKDGDKTKTMTG